MPHIEGKMNRSAPIVLILVLVIAVVGYLALQDPQSPFSQRPIQVTQPTTSMQATTTVPRTTVTTALPTATVAILTTTQTSSRSNPPSIKVVSFAVVSRILGSRADLVTVALKLKNEGGSGTAIVQIIQVLGVSKYKVFEKSYFLPANGEQAYTESFDASPDAEYFEVVITQQIPA